MKEYKFSDISVGTAEEFNKLVSHEDLMLFSKLTGDTNPLHLDDIYTKTTPYGKRVVFGLLVTSLLSKLAGMHLPGKYSLIISVESNFKKPCFVGDELKIVGEVVQKIEATNIIVIKTSITNQKNEILQVGRMHIKVLK